MDIVLKHPLSKYLLAMADDELILGHRNSEWCGLAPILEEDIAFANIALDEIAHANLWYELLADLEEMDRKAYPNQLVFFRDAADFRNVQLVELTKGNWAFTMLRQYLFDAYELIHLQALEGSRYKPLADTTAKIRREEMYHFRHTRAWIRRLSLGTKESHRLTQHALDEIWPYIQQVFVPLSDQTILVEGGYVPDLFSIKSDWDSQVIPFLEECELKLPNWDSLRRATNFDRSHHTKHLNVLVVEMQSVARLDPQAEW